MKNMVGKPARGDSFYPRKKEMAILLRSIDAGNNLQLAAPRRVGKSSILYYYKDNPIKGYSFIYIDVEDIETENDFYKEIYKEILRCEHLNSVTQFIEQLRSSTSNFFKKLKGFSIKDLHIDLNEEVEVNYKEELENFMTGLDTKGIKIVMMVDEFPEVILNIIQRNKGSFDEAVHFLQANRAFRNHEGIFNKIQFIYTGSNSLNHTVARLDATALINDLQSIPVGPLSEEEATELLTAILSSYGSSISKELLDYILSKTEWLLPFYIQLIISELLILVGPGIHIADKETVDKAFNQISELRNQQYFDHYISRLRRLYKDQELEMVRAILAHVAQKAGVDFNELVNISAEYGFEKECRKYLEALIYDGYIYQKQDRTYIFHSPILKLWWLRHECN